MSEELSLLEKWSLKVHELKLGVSRQEGGSCSAVFKIGGQGSLPFLFKEGDIPHPPIIAAEVFDSIEDDWPISLQEDLCANPQLCLDVVEG